MKKRRIGIWLAAAGSFVILFGGYGRLDPFANGYPASASNASNASNADFKEESDGTYGDFAGEKNAFLGITLVGSGAGNNGKTVLGEYRVQGKKECRRLLKELASSVRDSGRYELLVTGEDFEPETLILAQTFPEIINISNTVIREEKENGHVYLTCRIGFERKREEAFCDHVWEKECLSPPGCLTAGRERTFCSLCGKSEEFQTAALGHEDEFLDTVCDRCGVRIRNQNSGDKISVVYSGKEEELMWEFVCAGGDLEEGQRYYCRDIVPQELVFSSAEGIQGTAEEKIRWWLNTDFLNGISVRQSCVKVWLVDSSGNQMEAGEWKDGGEIRPGFLLSKASEFEVLKSVWSVGDVQVRTIGGIPYRFRCVDDDYRNNNSDNQRNALFLCESVIGSDIDSTETQRNIVTFGDDNNYKKSEVRNWLLKNQDLSSGEILPVQTGVNYAFQGKSENGGFESMTGVGLRSWKLPEQYLIDRLFLLSVEEAVSYKENLWDPEGQGTPFGRGYWLRTPVYEEDEDGRFCYGSKAYVVDLENGCIRPVEVGAGEFGIRPAFCLPQA